MGNPTLLPALAAAVAPHLLFLNNDGINIAVSGLSVSRYTQAAVTSYRALNLTITGCNFTQHSNEAISLIGQASGVTFSGNYIGDSGRGFRANVLSNPLAPPFTVASNTLVSIGMLPGFGPPGIDGANGIQVDGDATFIVNNSLVSRVEENKRHLCISDM